MVQNKEENRKLNNIKETRNDWNKKKMFETETFNDQ